MSVARKPSARTISTTDQLPARLTDTCAMRGSRARAAASISWHSATFFAKGIRSSGFASSYRWRLVRGGGAACGWLAGSSKRERLGGAADRPGADVAGMGEAGHLARHGAQAETGVGRIIGGLQSAVVEAEALGRAILQVELAVVGLGERFARERLRQVGVERVGAIEEAAGVGWTGHGRRYRHGAPHAQTAVRDN